MNDISRWPIVVLVLFGAVASSCDLPGPAGTDHSPTASFVTLLGADTVAVEQFRRTPSGMEADVVLRTPRTSLWHYEIALTDGGQLVRYEASRLGADGEADREPQERIIAEPAGDSLRIVTSEGGESSSRTFAAGPYVLPFIDMVHWPFELMLSRAQAATGDSITQELFTTRGTLPFVIRRVSRDSMTVTHPFRGTMGMVVDDAGRLILLDAGATTRKLVVERTAAVDLRSLAASFSARDEQGRSFGVLSGRGLAEALVEGASIRVDYGTPSKRGRQIFGALVPYGEVWRTGANRATHFVTDRDLDLRGLRVPAGEYTIYTIPEEDGGTLIVNTQTGQGGTTYNTDLDLGRVRMERRTLEHSVEVFTIVVEGDDRGGTLGLQWDRTELYVPFHVVSP